MGGGQGQRQRQRQESGSEIKPEPGLVRSEQQLLPCAPAEEKHSLCARRGYRAGARRMPWGTGEGQKWGTGSEMHAEREEETACS